jgi:hypothetical protein
MQVQDEAKNTIYCDCCGEDISSLSVKEQRLTIDQEVADVSYFTCPSCGMLYVIFILDGRARHLKADYDRYMKRMMRMRRVTQADADVAFAKLRRLKDRNEKLKNRYLGGLTVVSVNNADERLEYHDWRGERETGGENGR